MKIHILPPAFRFPRFLSLAAIALALPASLMAQTTYYWQAPSGGNGTWSTSTASWYTGTDGSGGPVAWTNPAPPYNVANFLAGTSGNVSVNGTVNSSLIGFGDAIAGAGSAAVNYALTGDTINLLRPSSGQILRVFGANSTVSIANNINLWESSAASNTIDMNGNGASLTITGNIHNLATTVGARTLQVTLFGSSTFTVNGNITSASSFGTTLNLGTVSSSNTATYAFGGNNTGLTGAVTFNRGTLVLNNSGALAGATGLTVANASANADTGRVLIGTGGVEINKNISFNTAGSGSVNTGDVRTIGGSNSTGISTFSGDITLGAFAVSGSGSQLEVTAATGGTTVFSGLINDGANTVPIIKTGGGIAKFTRTAGNTYDGVTTVSAGTLLINNDTGSGTGSGAIAVSSGATFGGNGAADGAITLAAGAAFSPGDMNELGVSTADSFAGTALTWNSNNTTASLLFDLGTTSDLLTLSGAFAKGTGTDFIFNFENVGGLALTTYTLVEFASTSFIDEGDFSFTSSIAGLAGNFILNADNLQFQVTAVPEPSTVALGIAGLSLTLLRRRTAARG